METLRKLLQLTAREFRVLLQAALLLLLVRLALKFVTVGRLQLVGTGKLGKPNPKAIARLSPKAIARLVRVAAELGPVRARCLPQSLVLRWLLVRRGTAARIVFGARKAGDEMQAHAWVEVDGVALSEDHGIHRDFAPLNELVAGS